MKLLYVLSVGVMVLLLTGCGSTTPTEADVIVEDSEDSTVSSSRVRLHNQGKACASCHAQGSSNEETFDSGATIFTEINAVNGDASKIAQNYSLRLVLQNSIGTENYRSGRGTGNFYTNFNAGITNYTVEVVNAKGVVVNSSAMDSHNSSRFDCNSCHTATGTNGAPGRILSKTFVPVTTTTTSSSAPQFSKEVKPILTDNCAGCHGSKGNFSITNSTPYTGTMQFVDTTTPTNSRLLKKGSGVRHDGGVQLSSSEYVTIRDWISAGALNN